MLWKVCMAVLACAFAAACSVHEHKTVVAPEGAASLCASRGYNPGTDAYNACIAREADRRS